MEFPRPRIFFYRGGTCIGHFRNFIAPVPSSLLFVLASDADEIVSPFEGCLPRPDSEVALPQH